LSSASTEFSAFRPPVATAIATRTPFVHQDLRVAVVGDPRRAMVLIDAYLHYVRVGDGDRVGDRARQSATVN